MDVALHETVPKLHHIMQNNKVEHTEMSNKEDSAKIGVVLCARNMDMGGHGRFLGAPQDE